MATPTDVAVGIDVAKAQLDIAVEPQRRDLDGAALAGRVAALAGATPGAAADPHRAGSQRRLRAHRGRHPGRGRPAGHPRQSAPDPRTSPAPSGAWPRPTGWTRRCWPGSPPEVRPQLRPQPSAAAQDLQILSRRRRQLVNDRTGPAAAAAPGLRPPGPGRRPRGRGR